MPFEKGKSGNPGGRRKSSISAALAEIVDPNHVAETIYAIALDENTNTRERLQALALIVDRLEGKAIARNVNLSATASQVLPHGFDALPAETKIAIVREIRSKALRAQPLTRNPDAESQPETEAESARSEDDDAI